MTQRTMNRLLLSSLLTVMLAAGLGCQSSMPSMKLANPFSKPTADQPDFDEPTKVAVIWKETALAGKGKKATRGFGGRVYFYNKENEAVRVDGDLVVYAYDDTTKGASKTDVPDRKYVFKAADLQKHFSETDSGPSYSVWLPWDKVGGAEKTVSLMPVFQPLEGRPIPADLALAILPGKMPSDRPEIAEQADGTVRQVSVSIPSNAGQHGTASLLGVTDDTATINPADEILPSGRPRTTTIELPRSMGNRLNEMNQRFPQTVPSQNSRAAANTLKQNEADLALKQQLLDRVTGSQLSVKTTEELTRDQSDRERRSSTYGKPGPLR